MCKRQRRCIEKFEHPVLRYKIFVQINHVSASYFIFTFRTRKYILCKLAISQINVYYT